MVAEMASGHFDKETGNFSGIVGEMVKNRGDVCFQSILMSGFVDELRLASVVNQHDLHALVSTGNTTNQSPDVLDTFSYVNGICYMAFAASCIVLATVVTMGDVKSSNIRIYSLKLARVLWSSVETILDQENLAVIQLPSRIGWCVMCIAIYVLVHGYVLNLVSTDIAVPIKPRVIDAIDDFFEPEFKHVQPAIFTTFWFLNRLVNEPVDTKLGKLFQERMLRVDEQNKCHTQEMSRCSIIDLKFDSKTLPDDSMTFFKQIADGKKSLLTEKGMYEAVQQAACAIKPDMVKSLRLTETSFAAGPIATVMRSDLPLAFRQYYAYRSRSLYLEAGLTVEIVRQALREQGIAKLGANPFDWRFEKCMVNIFDDQPVNDGHDMIQLPLKSLRTLTKLTLVFYVISVCLLMVELCYCLLVKVLRRVRFLNRITSQAVTRRNYNFLRPTVAPKVWQR